MYYTYVLQSLKDQSFYIGSTNDLKRRLGEHNEGLSRYTKSFKPWKLLYYEAYISLTLARRREHQLKRFGKAFTMLRKRLEV